MKVTISQVKKGAALHKLDGSRREDTKNCFARYPELVNQPGWNDSSQTGTERRRKEAVSSTSSLVLSELTAIQRKGNAVTQQVNPKTAWTEARRMMRTWNGWPGHDVLLIQLKLDQGQADAYSHKDDHGRSPAAHIKLFKPQLVIQIEQRPGTPRRSALSQYLDLVIGAQESAVMMIQSRQGLQAAGLGV